MSLDIARFLLGMGHWAKQFRVPSKEVRFRTQHGLKDSLPLTALLKGMGKKIFILRCERSLGDGES